MGCASSSPLMESGKHLVESAKETASDAVTKSEKALQDVGETAKDGIATGMENIKESVQTAFNSAEQSVGNVVGKIGETLSFTSSPTSTLEPMKDEIVHSADAAVSEAETVVMSDVKEVTEEAVQQMETSVEDLEEDVEQHFDMLGDSVDSVMEKKVEEVLKGTPVASPEKEIKKEELPPTFWEAAADAILLRKTVRSLDFHAAATIAELGDDNIVPPPLPPPQIEIICSDDVLERLDNGADSISVNNNKCNMDLYISDKTNQ